MDQCVSLLEWGPLDFGALEGIGLESGEAALGPVEVFFLFDTGNRVTNLREPIVQDQTRSFQWSTSIICQGTANRQAVTTDGLSLRVSALF